jgi:hypothetical protein
MAWHARCATWHQTSDEDLRVIHTEHATFGPFDSWDDVAAWVQERLYDPSVAPA